MANQINVGDQNTQQIGRNTVSQTSQTPEKPKFNYWMILTLVFAFLFIIVVGIFVVNYGKQKTVNLNQPNTSPQTSLTFSPTGSIALDNCRLFMAGAVDLSKTTIIVSEPFGAHNEGVYVAVDIPYSWCVEGGDRAYFINAQDGQKLYFTLHPRRNSGVVTKQESRTVGGIEVIQKVMHQSDAAQYHESDNYVTSIFKITKNGKSAANEFYLDLPKENREQLLSILDSFITNSRIVTTEEALSIREKLNKTVLTCENINGLSNYQLCGKDSDAAYISGPNSLEIKHVSGLTLSPNKEWLFVGRYSDAYALSGGAPSENALTMVDIKNAKAFELFSQIYFPNYQDPVSWSSDGKGIVFTAGEAATPNILGNPNMFAVVYCTTSCRVLAKNAGPVGIGGDPAYFEGNEVIYTGMNDEKIRIPFNQ